MTVVFFVILVLRLAGSTGKRRQTPPLCLRAYAEFPVDLYFPHQEKIATDMDCVYLLMIYSQQ